jgi:hypothetical protein
MRRANETNNKKRPTKTQKQEAKARSKSTRNEAKTECQEKQEEGAKKAGKRRTQTATTQQPTHYESLGFVPGPQFGDPKRQEGPGVMALATPAVPPAADCGTAPPCGGRLYRGPARGLTFGLLPNKWINERPMWHLRAMRRDPRIRLDPQTVEAIARRVVELLEKRGLQGRELVDAAELARRLGIERSWVYSHAIELGAVKLGKGAKPRLRFDPEIAAQVLQRVDDTPTADPPARSGKRAAQPEGSEGRVELLPIQGQDDSGSAS